ncbi:MAG: hypothetical protein KDD53_07675, partial [Bdellovibrionales bacterium]|nr:hypothetical protein [Bdellovibrionales bacterium]
RAGAASRFLGELAEAYEKKHWKPATNSKLPDSFTFKRLPLGHAPLRVATVHRAPKNVAQGVVTYLGKDEKNGLSFGSPASGHKINDESPIADAVAIGVLEWEFSSKSNSGGRGRLVSKLPGYEDVSIKFTSRGLGSYYYVTLTDYDTAAHAMADVEDLIENYVAQLVFQFPDFVREQYQNVYRTRPELQDFDILASARALLNSHAEWAAGQDLRVLSVDSFNIDTLSFVTQFDVNGSSSTITDADNAGETARPHPWSGGQVSDAQRERIKRINRYRAIPFRGSTLATHSSAICAEYFKAEFEANTRRFAQQYTPQLTVLDQILKQIELVATLQGIKL